MLNTDTLLFYVKEEYRDVVLLICQPYLSIKSIPIILRVIESICIDHPHTIEYFDLEKYYTQNSGVCHLYMSSTNTNKNQMFNDYLKNISNYKWR